jgi:hypothetical protein
MTTNDRDAAKRRLTQAIRMGPLALLRLRAETLLGYANEGRIELAQEERDALDRIAVAPDEDDWVFLGQFDQRLESME